MGSKMMKVYEHKDPFYPLPSTISPAVLEEAEVSVSSYSLDWHLLPPVANLSVAAVTSGVSAQPGTTEHMKFIIDTVL